MRWIRMKSCICRYLREVSSGTLRILSVAMYLAVIYAMWVCQLGPAVSELKNARRELEERHENQGAEDAVRRQLRKTQEEVLILRAETRNMYDPGDRTTHENKTYRYLEWIATRSGLRIRSFESESQGSIKPENIGFSKVVLEGLFPDVVKFVGELAVAPATLRLDIFEASVREDMPETISLSLSLSDVMEPPPDLRVCDAHF